MIRKILTCCLLITVLVPLAWSQERAIRPVAGVVDSNIRQALVIGNSEYRHAGRLRNTVNDGRSYRDCCAETNPWNRCRLIVSIVFASPSVNSFSSTGYSL